MYYVLCLYASYIYITMCNYCELCNSWVSILVFWPPPTGWFLAAPFSLLRIWGAPLPLMPALELGPLLVPPM